MPLIGRHDVITRIAVAVPIAIVIVGIARPHKQVIEDQVDVHHDTGTVMKPRLRIHSTAEIHWCEYKTTLRQAVVPITVDIHHAARCPAPASRNPHPVVVALVPIARLPPITDGGVLPIARHIKILIAWRGTGRAGFQRFGRRLAIDELFGLGRDPKAWHPFPPAAHNLPITRYPALAGRRHTPDTANPQEVSALFIPCPIAGNPNCVFVVRSIFRWQFVDRLWRLLIDNQRFLNAGGCRLGIRFV